VIKPRLIADHELLGPLHDSNDRRTFEERHGRRLLIGDLMTAAVAGEIDPRALGLSKPVLAREDEYPWVSPISARRSAALQR
jgi:hypothetical protein